MTFSAKMSDLPDIFENKNQIYNETSFLDFYVSVLRTNILEFYLYTRFQKIEVPNDRTKRQ